LVRTNMFDYFGTPKNNKHILIYNALQGCPEKVRKTGKREDLEFKYDLKMYPSFLLLDREGKMIANPCPYPSEDLEGTINKILLSDPIRSGSENR